MATPIPVGDLPQGTTAGEPERAGRQFNTKNSLEF
jgi:hypothetical protein